MTEPADDRANALSQRVLRVQTQLEESMRHLAGSMARLQASRQAILAGRSDREKQHDSAYARLEARLATMPAIEQAKGIVMAQTGCGPEEAFRAAAQGLPAGQRPGPRAGSGRHRPGRRGDPGLFGGPGRRGDDRQRPS